MHHALGHQVHLVLDGAVDGASGDAASADILTEIVRGIDKWLWFVEAHLPDRAAPAPA